MESLAAQCLPIKACLDIKTRPDEKPAFINITLGKYCFVPPTPKAMRNYIIERVPSTVLRDVVAYFGTDKAEESYAGSLVPKDDAVVFPGTQLDSSEIEKVAKLDLARLIGGVQNIPGGNPFTGFAMFDIERQSCLGRIACLKGFKPDQDYRGGGDFPYPLYEARPWTKQEVRNSGDPIELGSAELRIEDNLTTEISNSTYKLVYRTAVLAALIIANQYSDVKQNGVNPKRVICPLIDVTHCTEDHELAPRVLEILAMKAEVLQELGFVPDGRLSPKTDAMDSDNRNISGHVRVVYVMDMDKIKKCFTVNIAEPGVQTTRKPFAKEPPF